MGGKENMKKWVKKMTSLFLAGAMSASVLTGLGSISASAAGGDLAKGKPTTASGYFNDASLPSFATDGNEDTKWCETDNGIADEMVKWLMVDLGKATTVDSYVVKNAEVGGEFKDYNTRDFIIQISDDARHWKSVDCIRGNSAKIVERKIKPFTARYVRLYINWATQRNTVGGDAGYTRIYGFELYNGDYTPMEGWSEGYEGKATGITVTPEITELEVNHEVTLGSQITPEDALQTCTWSTADPNIVEVGCTTGRIRGVRKGKATITATADDGGLTKNFDITFTGGDIVLSANQTLWMIEEDGKLKNEILMPTINDVDDTECWLKVNDGTTTEIQHVGVVKSGQSTISAFVPEVKEEKKVTIEIYSNAECTGKPINMVTTTVKPVRKWKFYVVQNMHMDIGFTNPQNQLIQTMYPNFYQNALSMIETSKNWDLPSQFRYPAEQNFLLYGSALKYPDANFYEKIKKGLSTGNLSYPTSMASSCYGFMSPELLARNTYPGARFLPDMTGVNSTKVINITDVPGIPRAAVDYYAEAGAKYFSFRPNNDTMTWSYSRYPRIFYLVGRQPENKLLTWSSFHYGIDEFDFRHDRNSSAPGGVASNEYIRALTDKVLKDYQTESYPYDAILANFTEGGDNGCFNANVAYNIKALNDRKSQTGKNYVYPQFVNSTETDFYEYMEENYADVIPDFSQGFEDYWSNGNGTFSRETAIADKMKDKLPEAEKYATLANTFGGEYPKEKIDGAYDHMAVWNEHTYGSGPSGSKVDDNWSWQRNNVLAADSAAESVRNDALDTISSQIPTTGKAVSVFNSLNWKRTDIVTLQSSELPKYYDIVDRTTGKTVPYQVLDDGTVTFAAENVPANGYKVFDVKERQDAPTFTSSVKTTDDSIENDFFKVTFDASGSIKSIIDKQNGNREMVDANAPYAFNQFIYLNTKTPAGQKHNVVGETDKITGAELTGSTGAVKGSVVADGTKGIERAVDSMKREVILYDNIPRIDIKNTVIKREAPQQNTLDEEGFFVFPVNMGDNFKIEHETVSGRLDPTKVSKDIYNPENELMYGSSTDFFTVNRWIDIGNKSNYGVMFNPINAPLVQYSQRNSYKFNPDNQITKPYIYSWVYNNKWWTNYQKTQPGPVTFEYSIQSRTGQSFADGRADQKGLESNTPLVAEVIETRQGGSLSENQMQFVTISADNVQLIAAKQAEQNGEGIIFRFNETLGKETNVIADLSAYGIASVVETTIVEDDMAQSKHNVRMENGKVMFTIPADGVVTIRGLTGGAKPAKVSNVTATYDSKGTLVKWDAVEGASYYYVYRSADNDFTAGAGSFLATTDEPQYHDHQVKNGATGFHYRVVAVREGVKSDASDVASAKSGTVKTTVAPSAPSNLRLDYAYASRVTLRWDPSQDDIAVTEYRVYRNGEQIGTVNPDFCSTMDYNLPADGNCTYTVRAVDRDGNVSADSNIVHVDVQAVIYKDDITANIAPNAQITASSFFYQEAPDGRRFQYQPQNIADGIIGVAEQGEWCSSWEVDPWIRLSLDKEYTINQINLYGRNSAVNTAKKVKIAFSDGSSIDVDNLPANSSKQEVKFDEKKVEWVQISVTEGVGCPGFSEVEVLRTDAPNPDEVVQIIPDYSTVTIAYRDADSGEEIQPSYTYANIIGSKYKEYIDLDKLTKAPKGYVLMKTTGGESDVITSVEETIVCSYKHVGDALPEEPVTIKLTPEQLTLKAGETGQLTAAVTPDDAGTVSWSSSNDAIATVDANGLVTAKAAGLAVISAKVGDTTAVALVQVKADTNEPVVKKNGWVEVDGKQIYFENDVAVANRWVKTDGKWYYTDAKGARTTGWKKVGSKWYLMNGAGVMQTGWVKAGSKWYFMESSGAMVTGWKKLGKWYLFGSDGAMQTGWAKVGTKWYYMNGAGVMQTGWVKAGSKWYYMNSAGAMQTGWVKVGSKWYFMNSAGAMQTGWVKVGSKWYFMDGSGKMLANTSRSIGGKAYRFHTNGVCLNP